MKIGEINRAGNFRELESFRKIAVIGHDTFTTQKVDFDTVDKICEILGNFKRTMNDYGVRNYTAMATSAIREAKNRDYILDQIEIKTGLEVQVIDNSQEQFLTLKAVKYYLENFDTLTEEGVIIVVIGAGSIQVTAYQKGELISSQNVKMGALRIKEILGDMEGSVLKYNQILEEYIRVNMDSLIISSEGLSYQHIIVVGGEMSVIGGMLSHDPDDDRKGLKKKDVAVLHQELQEMTVEEIRTKYSVKRERAEIVMPSMMLLKHFSQMTTGKYIISPKVSLVDGIVRHIHENIYNLRLDEAVTRDVINNARVLAQKFHYNEEHCHYVEDTAIMLFDKLKKVHGLKLERQLLRVAAIMHDIGKFISLDNHSSHSYELIKPLELFGMSTMDMEIIALISKYHGMKAPTSTKRDFGNLPREQRLVASKLIAILRLADALDRGHNQKINVKSIKVKDKVLTIKGVSKEDTTLEEWNFVKKGLYFKEVFGIKPELKISREV